MLRAVQRRLPELTCTASETSPKPPRIARLEIEPVRGFVIPWNVLRDETGKAHFTVNNEKKRLKALWENLCPICGEANEGLIWFIGGPKSSFHPDGWFLDLPGHCDCLEYALQVCPYLAARNYTPYEIGELNRKLTTSLPKHILTVDYTQDPNRPTVFVMTGAKGITINGPYVRPVTIMTRRYWTKGERLTRMEGERLSREALL